MGFPALTPGVQRFLVTLQKAGPVWEAVLGELQLQVTRPSYETWLSGTVGIAHNDGEFVVGAPNTFVAEMLEQRMYLLISQALERVVQRDVDVSFQVLPQEPSANGRASGDNSTLDGSSNGLGRTAQPQEEALPPRHGHSIMASNGVAAMNPRYTFDTFIVGASNELAHAAACAVSERPGLTYNPLFIYSGVGLGKTHLLHAIGHQVRANGLSLIYRTTEEFTNEYIKAIREGKTEEFRNRYRTADVLLLDDIQFVIGKEQTQEGFFHTFNALHVAGRQIVVTSDRPVAALTLLEDRVLSRLSGGLVVDVQTPDLETRLAILRAKVEGTRHHFPPEVLQFLAERIHTNVRELEGSLNRIDAYADLTESPISLELVKGALADTLNPLKKRRIPDHIVLDTVSTYFSVDKDALGGRHRDKHTVLARHVAMYLLREEANLPLTTIGRILGGKDHSTVLHAWQRISKQLNEDTHLRQDVINIRETLARSV